jgi:Lrp/AsnC family leucine-responsive transcriptional regulator
MGVTRERRMRGKRQATPNGVARGGPLLDAVNRRLLEELLENPRLSNAELGRRVELSGVAVGERLQRLERSGVIEGVRLHLNAAALGVPLSAYVHVRPAPGQLDAIVRLAEQTLDVVECHRVVGDDRLLLKLQVADMGKLTKVVDRFLALGQTTTSIVQGSQIPPRRLPCPMRTGRTETA